MTDFQKVQAYQSTMTQAQMMLTNGIIDREDLALIESKIAEKYGLKKGSINREIDLINIAFRANMM